MNAPSLTHIRSRGFKAAKPELSVLVPFFRDNPSELLSALLLQNGFDAVVEILIYDDGTNDTEITAQVRDIITEAKAPVSLLIAEQNCGRSHARNSLVDQARANWVLFLDADMRPVTNSFLSDYIAAMKTQDADIIFGGFHVPQITEDKEQELHRVFSETSDALSAEMRRKHGPQYVCSSNLCVKKRVLETEPFDPDFTGWGWEDSEWAARAGAAYSISHIDNPALHLGLESTDTLLSRFSTSGQNYRKFTSRHPELAKTLTLFRIVSILKKLPGQKILRPLLKLTVKSHAVPIKLRLFALKLWRASWYAEVKP